MAESCASCAASRAARSRPGQIVGAHRRRRMISGPFDIAGSAPGLSRAAAVARRTSPREALERIAAYPDPAVWITRVPEDDVLARAKALTRKGQMRALPLYGVPFAVKDNIDCAGLPTTAGCPAFAYTPAENAARRRAAARGGRDPDRQDQSRSVRDRPGRHALAVRRAAQRLRHALYLRRIELGLGGRGRGGPGRVRARHRYGGLRPRAGRVQQYRRPEADARLAQHARRRARLPHARLRLDLRATAGDARTFGRRCAATTQPTTIRADGSDPRLLAARDSRFGVLSPSEREFFGDDRERTPLCARDRTHGSARRHQSRDRFLAVPKAGALLYEGPWVAERSRR